MRYYTIFLGDKLWQNVIDDMNTMEIWSIGGMIFTSRRKVNACINDLKKSNFETKKERFTIKEINIK